ncbi:reverse transcriptase [Plakobranchus ocellatus]|uniref:Reverse transcriptase n=1 Tax=Plakobranchus ocellatus TaxID=259542 RepID=A0AAV3ZPB2_9GAST|nr:reverse transcriptase [Plakobranchus ocellatus]
MFSDNHIRYSEALGIIKDQAAEGSASPADLGGGRYMPPLKAFMGDATILCSKENETCRLLVRFDALMNWSRVSFKLKKS